jgi:hypothetical protein
LIELSEEEKDFNEISSGGDEEIVSLGNIAIWKYENCHRWCM